MAKSIQGDFVWYELITRDPPAAIAFYAALLGWRTEPFGQGDYTMWVGPQGPLGGVVKLTGELQAAGMQPHWMAHVQVQDVDASARLAAARGGKVAKEPTDLPTVGRFAVITDPQGAELSLFQPTQAMELHDLARDGELCWHELITSADVAAARFYGELLGWKVLEEMDMGAMGKYRIFGLDGRRIGGMMTAPPGASMPAWLYYASTGDLDAAIGRAAPLGGKIVNGPVDIPGGGRIAQLVDPQGAAFALHQAPRPPA
jgi:predicted enzyme related to lactoylglutathione lyase